MSYAREHQWVVEVFTIVLLTALAQIVVKLVLDRLSRQLDRTKNNYDNALIDAARAPARVGIWLVGISFAAQAVGGEIEDQAEVFQYVPTIRDVGVVWLIIWFAVRYIRRVEDYIANPQTDSKFDPTTARAVGKLLRASVVITGFLLALQAFGISVTGVLAFGGIGGIAVGFAARDLLANFFGAFMIFLDRPFSVGDWIRSPDREIEGTVEDIGWRLTRIRTFDKRPLYIPNAVFTAISVENPSRMQNRRINETFGIRYDDIHAMEAICADIKVMLENHDAIDATQTLMVNFVEYSASSVDFFIYTFTKTTVWTEFHEIKQDVLLKIADIVAGHDAEFAFPTQTLHVHPEPDPAVT